MSEMNTVPDFSSVKDPIARGFLEQMGPLNTSLQKIIEQQQKALDEQTGIIKQLERVGVPMARSTLGDIFHRAGDLLCVLRNRMLDLLPSQLYVNADETRIPVLAPEKTRQAYLLTFIAHPMVVYVYNAGRSGETPRRVLGESQGFILRVVALGRKTSYSWATMKQAIIWPFCNHWSAAVSLIKLTLRPI